MCQTQAILLAVWLITADILIKYWCTMYQNVFLTFKLRKTRNIMDSDCRFDSGLYEAPYICGIGFLAITVSADVLALSILISWMFWKFM